MKARDKLREQWPWNDRFRRLILIAPSAFGVLATAISFPFAGVHALWFLTAIIFGVVFYSMYGVVGRKVAAIAEEVSQDGEIAEAMLVIGMIESPGIAILRSSEVELVSIVGKRCSIAFSEIESIKEGNWLPGKYVWGKRAFLLSTTAPKRLAFAVPESLGVRWSAVLQNR